MPEPLEFAKGGVPTRVAAEVFGKSEMWVRQMIHNGMLPIGIATEPEGSKKLNVYISPKLLYEYTGYIYRGKKKEQGCIQEDRDPGADHHREVAPSGDNETGRSV